MILGVLHIAFNNSKYRALHMGARLDHDFLLGTLSATIENLIKVALNDPSVFLQLDQQPVPARRTLCQLQAAGYSVKPRLRDPFSETQLEVIAQALQR